MKTYTDQVVINYCNNFEKAITEVNDTFVNLYKTFESIINGGTYQFPEEQTTRWNTLLSTSATKAIDLINKIEEKYNDMKAKAQKYDDIVNLINSHIGHTNTKVETVSAEVSYHSTSKIVGAKPFADGEGYPAIIYETEKVKKTKAEDGTITSEVVSNTPAAIVCKTIEEANAFLENYGN